MPRTGNTFDWALIDNWADPQTSSNFSISGWNALRDDLKAELTRSLTNDGTGSLTGQLKAYEGSVGTPGIAFSNEAATGWYRISANVWGFAVGGVLKYTFKDGALVSDNNTSVVTSAAITTALAAISAFTPRYGQLTLTGGIYSSSRVDELLTSARLAISWTTGTASGVTQDTTDGTLTVGATGIYRVTYSFSGNFAVGVADLGDSLRLMVKKVGGVALGATIANSSVDATTLVLGQFCLAGTAISSLTSGDELGIYALGLTDFIDNVYISFNVEQIA
jgi:hypothetical protein